MTDEGHEAAVGGESTIEVVAAAGEGEQGLRITIADGDDHAAAIGELVDEGCGRLGGAGGDEYGIERGGVGPTECAIAGVDRDVGETQRVQNVSRAVGQFGATLNADDVL